MRTRETSDSQAHGDEIVKEETPRANMLQARETLPDISRQAEGDDTQDDGEDEAANEGGGEGGGVERGEEEEGEEEGEGDAMERAKAEFDEFMSSASLASQRGAGGYGKDDAEGEEGREDMVTLEESGGECRQDVMGEERVEIREAAQADGEAWDAVEQELMHRLAACMKTRGVGSHSEALQDGVGIGGASAGGREGGVGDDDERRRRDTGRNITCDPPEVKEVRLQ